jgi:hypothetical protein
MSEQPPSWAFDITDIFKQHRDQVDTTIGNKNKSDEILEILRQDLEQHGFEVESGKKKADKIHRPVSFGEQGKVDLKYEIDAYHTENSIAMEIEAGRATLGNAIYRDITQMSLMVDVEYAVIAVSQIYRYKQSGKEMESKDYQKCLSILQAIYLSNNLELPFKGILLIGY